MHSKHVRGRGRVACRLAAALGAAWQGRLSGSQQGRERQGAVSQAHSRERMVLEGRRLGLGRQKGQRQQHLMHVWRCTCGSCAQPRGKLPATEAVHHGGQQGIRKARAPSAGQLQRRARPARPRLHQPTQGQPSSRCSTHLGQGVEEVQGGLRMQLGSRPEERHGGQTAGRVSCGKYGRRRDGSVGRRLAAAARQGERGWPCPHRGRAAMAGGPGMAVARGAGGRGR